MNRYLGILVAVLSVSALAADADVTSYRATTDYRHIIDSHGYSKSEDTETFIIAATDRNGRPLTPRVERLFDGKGTIKPNKGVYTLSATCKTDSANNTTIFQLLNHDPKTDDAHKPVYFVTVFPGDDGSKWQIYSGNKAEKGKCFEPSRRRVSAS